MAISRREKPILCEQDLERMRLREKENDDKRKQQVLSADASPEKYGLWIKQLNESIENKKDSIQKEPEL